MSKNSSTSDLSFKCSQNKKKVCFVQAEYVTTSNRIDFTKSARKEFTDLYGIKVFTRYNYTPSIICRKCRSNLNNSKNYGTPLFYNYPARFKRPKDDHSNCFLCLIQTPTSNLNYQPGSEVIYPKNSNLTQPIEMTKDNIEYDDIIYNEELNVNDYDQLNNYYEDDSIDENNDSLEDGDPDDKEYFATKKEENEVLKKRKLDVDKKVSNDELSKLIATMGVGVKQSVLLAQFFRKSKFVAPDFSISKVKYRSNDLKDFFQVYNEKTVYMKNINNFYQLYLNDYDSTKFRLFLDSGSNHFLGCLIYIPQSEEDATNARVIPVFFSLGDIKETYSNLKLVLELLDYKTHNWYIVSHFKVTNMLMGKLILI